MIEPNRKRCATLPARAVGGTQLSGRRGRYHGSKTVFRPTCSAEPLHDVTDCNVHRTWPTLQRFLRPTGCWGIGAVTADKSRRHGAVAHDDLFPPRPARVVCCGRVPPNLTAPLHGSADVSRRNKLGARQIRGQLGAHKATSTRRVHRLRRPTEPPCGAAPLLRQRHTPRVRPTQRGRALGECDAKRGVLLTRGRQVPAQTSARAQVLAEVCNAMFKWFPTVCLPNVACRRSRGLP